MVFAPRNSPYRVRRCVTRPRRPIRRTLIGCICSRCDISENFVLYIHVTVAVILRTKLHEHCLALPFEFLTTQKHSNCISAWCFSTARTPRLGSQCALDSLARFFIALIALEPRPATASRYIHSYIGCLLALGIILVIFIFLVIVVFLTFSVAISFARARTAANADGGQL